MTVYVVTLNGRPLSVAASEAVAQQQMALVRAKKPHDGWRPVGPLGWASLSTTSLRAIPMACEAA